MHARNKAAPLALPSFAALAALVALGAPFLACAAGDMSLQVGPGAVTTQTEESDSGATVADSGSSTGTNLPPPSHPASDDSGATPPASDDAGAPPASDDAGQAVEDSAPPPAPPAEDSGSTSSCPGYAPPSTPAGCDCDPSEHTCTANGCYNGYYCKLSSETCEQKPSSC